MKKRFGKYHDFIVLWTMFWSCNWCRFINGLYNKLNYV